MLPARLEPRHPPPHNAAPPPHTGRMDTAPTAEVPPAEPRENTAADRDSADLRAALKRVWGYDTFRPLQREAMGCGLADRDSVVVLPTGGGKSLCYQTPAVVKGDREPGSLAVVVSPLISLMKDQVDALRANGVAAACVNSSLPASEQKAVAERIRAGELTLLYVAPERLVTEKMLRFLDRTPLALFAIDEAHCVSQWGHDFRPEYRQLGVLRERFPHVGVHAYTATASERVREDIAAQLNLRDAAMLVGSFDRPNLLFRAARRAGALRQICDVVARHPHESGIVYCISRKEVDKTATALNGLGHKALPYHAGKGPREREANQDAFLSGECDIMVATVAFGMGIDKPDVRFVVHAGMPKSLEHYQQEAGRAGRDGLEAECVLLHSGGDLIFWKDTLNELPPDARAAAAASLDALYDYAIGAGCRHRGLVEYFGQELPGENCGACDICLGEVETVDDPVVLGQKILSCVVRLEQRFGADYTADVLIGSKSERVLSQGHDALSTYGLLGDDTKRAVRGWIEQLVGQHYLEKVGEYGTLRVTQEGRILLKGDATPRLLAPEKKAAEKGRTAAAEDDWEGVDKGLFEHLRELRGEFAKDRGVPPYIIFNDVSLRGMAKTRPTTEEGLLSVTGVGPKKAQDFGERFLAAIADYCAGHDLSTDEAAAPAAPPKGRSLTGNAIMAFPLFEEGQGIEEVAERLGRARSTTCGYLQAYIEQNRVDDPSPWVPAETVRKAREAFEQCGLARLKPAFEHLEGAVSYDDLRIVAACMANAQEA